MMVALYFQTLDNDYFRECCQSDPLLLDRMEEYHYAVIEKPDYPIVDFSGSTAIY